MATPHVAALGRAAAAAPSRLDAGGGEVGARVHRRPGLGRHGADAGGAGHAGGRRARGAPGRDRPAHLHRPGLALVPRRERPRAERPAVRCSSGSRTPAAARARGRSGSSRRPRPPAPRSNIPGTIDIPPGGEADLSVVAQAVRRRGPGRELRLRRPPPGRGHAPRPVLLPRRQARARPGHRAAAEEVPGRRHAHRRRAASSTYRYPTAPFGNAPDSPPMFEDGAEKVYVTTLNGPAANAGVSVVGGDPGRADRPVLPRAPWTRTPCRATPARRSTSTG